MSLLWQEIHSTLQYETTYQNASKWIRYFWKRYWYWKKWPFAWSKTNSRYCLLIQKVISYLLKNCLPLILFYNPIDPINTADAGSIPSSKLSGKEVTCEICGKKLSEPASLYQYQKNHMGDKPQECPYCDKRFIQRYNMKQHMY